MSGTETPDTGKFWILNLTYIPLDTLIKRTHVKWKIGNILFRFSVFFTHRSEILSNIFGQDFFWGGWQNEVMVDWTLPEENVEKSYKPQVQGHTRVVRRLHDLKIVFHYIYLTHVKDNYVQWLDWSVTVKTRAQVWSQEDLPHSHIHLGWDDQYQSHFLMLIEPILR